MRVRWLVRVVLFSCFASCLAWSCTGHSEDLVKQVKKAVELSTLDQPGTHPFHLKADLAPSFERDKDSGRTGEVEIWWTSPSHWRREVRCPNFHQVQIIDGTQVWQQNDGDYNPEWLREISNTLVRPIPLSDEILAQVRSAEVKQLRGTTYLSWSLMSSNGDVQKGMGAGISFTDQTGLLFTANGFGWGGWFRDYKTFHNRQVPRTISSGTPEVTAKIVVLEDLDQVPPSLFDASHSGGDQSQLKTVLLDERSLRKNLVQTQAASWPTLRDGPLEGVLTTEVSIDRSGKVREIGVIVSDNPGIADAAREQIAAMRFSPFVENGITVQVVSRITLSFKTARPEGAATLESARVWFERGRHVGFPAAVGGTPYGLHAEFQAKGSSGAIETGHYEDVWMSDAQWRREATFGSSRYVRTRNGDKTYLLAQGPEARLLALVFQLIEPIPALDTFVESDWRINSESVDGVKTIRVLSGYESPNGKLDPEHARGFWFDPSGDLVKTFFSGVETRRSDFQGFGNVKVAHRIDVLKDGLLALRIQVTDITASPSDPKQKFELKGHEWTRSFTAEVR